MIGARPVTAAGPQPRWHGQPDGDVGTHELLYHTALRLFAEHGFESVSLRQLAAAMHLQPGSLYNHIESKQALLFELIETHESDLLALLQTKVARHAEGRLQLQRFVRVHLQFNSLHDQRHTLTRMEFRSLSLEQRERVEQLRDTRTRDLENILSRCGLPAGQRAPMALGMQALLDGVVAGYPQDARPPLESLTSLFTSMVLTGLSRPRA